MMNTDFADFNDIDIQSTIDIFSGLPPHAFHLAEEAMRDCVCIDRAAGIRLTTEPSAEPRTTVFRYRR